MRTRLVAVAVLCWAGVAISQPLADRQETFGGVVAPAVMPAGSNAAYGYVGAPEVGAGYRQGVGGIEVEAKGAFDYLRLGLSLDVVAKASAYKEGITEIAPLVGVGFSWDSGSRYFDTANFGYLAVRPRLGAIATLRLAEVARGIVQLEVPWAISLRPQYGSHFTPLLGAGAEFYLGGDISGLILGKAGVDAIKEPLGVLQIRVGWQVMLGLGYRLF